MDLDALDRSILDVLHGDGRASWPKIADEIGSSTSTVRRRFDSMQERGLVRIVGRTDVTQIGHGPIAMVLYRGREALRDSFIEALQAHPSVRFLAATLGTSHCIAELVPRSLPALRETLSGINQNFNVSSEVFVVTHTYTSGQDWLPVSARRDVDIRAHQEITTLTPEERLVMSELFKDARAPFSALAARAERSENTVRRIVDDLITRELLSYRVLVEPEVLGYASKFWALIDIEPAKLPAAAHVLAANQATKTLFATAGRYNLLGQFVLPHHTDTYEFTTEILGQLPGARDAETLIESGTYKRVWNAVQDNRYTGPIGPDWLFNP